MGADCIPPYTHDENLVPPHRGAALMFEDVRKPEQTSSIARCALWEYNDWTACPFPHFLQTLVPLLAIGSLGGDPPGLGEHGPKRNNLETEDFCSRSRTAGFRGECG